MLRFLAGRVLQSLLILLGVTMITFGLLFLVPADPVRMIAGRSASAETVESIRRQLGLDQPIPAQYLRYLGNLVQGDLGRSYVQKAEVSELVASRLPATLQLMLAAIFFELLLGLPAGIYSATRRNQSSDKVVMVLSFICVSAPQFVVGLLLLYLFAHKLGLFPLGGYGTPAHVVLPALTLGVTVAGWYSRMSRSSMVEVLRQDYIRTARAKGLSEWRVVLVHGLRNAILPDHRHDRHRHRPLYAGRRRRRVGVRLAGHRPARLAGDPASRHSHHPGGHAGRGLRHRHRQPARRHRDFVD